MSLIETQEPRLPIASPQPRGRVARSLAPLAIARNMFGLDYRSLALLRICFASCLLWVTVTHAWEMRIFYTDEGVLPRAILFNSVYLTGISLHFADGGLPYIATLFALQFILALMLLVGYRTRLATIGSYIFLLSLQNRHPQLIYGADNVLRVSLFWMMFLPLAQRFSLDRLTGRTAPAPDRPYLGIAGIAFIVQFVCIYSFGALMKTGDCWQIDHNAVAYALALDVYTRPLGHWIAQFPWVTTALTIFTLYLELYGPVLFILPVFSPWGRLLGILLFVGLQAGFSACMFLEYFGPVMITLTLVFLPPWFWERIAGPAGRWLATRCRRFMLPGWTHLADLRWKWVSRERAGNTVRQTSLLPRAGRSIRLALALLRDGVLAVLLVVLILWNVNNLPGQPARISPAVNTLVFTLGIHQSWDMFSPYPQTIDGWIVVAGKLRNGQTVDLMSGARPVSYDKPAWVPASYRNRLWMAYLLSFLKGGTADPEAFAIYLDMQWDQTHSGDEQIQSIEIDRMAQWIDVGPTKSDITRELVWIGAF